LFFGKFQLILSKETTIAFILTQKQMFQKNMLQKNQCVLQNTKLFINLKNSFRKRLKSDNKN